ncbi:MAG: NAD(P)-dependent oxidoreductase [Actinomycetes bacterium]
MTVLGRAVVTCELSEDGRDRLEQLGFEVVTGGWGTTRQPLSDAEMADVCAGARLVLTEIERVDEAVLRAAPDLLAVGTARGGPVNVDIPACSARGIPVLYTPARNAESVADFTIGLILSALRGISAGEQQLRGSGWLVGGELPYLHFRGRELSALTVDLVGFGAVGRAVARRLVHGFGTRVLWSDPYVAADDLSADARLGTPVPLPELLADSDVVSLHCARSAATERLIDEKALAAMRAGALLVNTAGGACVDEAALVSALEEGRVSAALDVFASEPLPPDSALLRAPATVLTPHLAGAATDVVAHHSRMLLDDVAAVVRGDAPRHCANPQVLAC